MSNIAILKRNLPEKESRFNFLRLDKNERVSRFELSFLRHFKNNLKSEHFTAYPELYTFYKKISKLHNLKPDYFLATNGIDNGLKSCIETFSNNKKAIIILKPTFAMIEIYCKLYKRKYFSIGYKKNFELDFDLILKSINKKISLIIISNPNSPTGTLINHEKLEKIILKAKGKNIKVVIDEAYFGFTKATAIKSIKKHNNVIVLRTFSKAYGIAGLRVGYIASVPKNILALKSCKPMYELNSLGILAANILLDNKKYYKNYIESVTIGKKYLTNFLKENKINYIDTHANFIFLKLKKNFSKTIKKLKKKKIKVSYNLKSTFLKNLIRITLGPKEEMIKIIDILKINEK